MLGLIFDGKMLTAATLTDGGEIVGVAEQPSPINDYREWLSAGMAGVSGASAVSATGAFSGAVSTAISAVSDGSISEAGAVLAECAVIFSSPLSGSVASDAPSNRPDPARMNNLSRACMTVLPCKGIETGTAAQ